MLNFVLQIFEKIAFGKGKSSHDLVQNVKTLCVDAESNAIYLYKANSGSNLIDMNELNSNCLAGHL